MHGPMDHAREVLLKDPTLPPELTSQILAAFLQVRMAYGRTPYGGKRSFPSHVSRVPRNPFVRESISHATSGHALLQAYVIYKILERVGDTEHRERFAGILRNKQKLEGCDRQWAAVCEELGWRSVPDGLA